MISKTDFFGIFYVKKPNGASFDSYYRTIDALRPLFNNEEFKEIVKGFYLNIYEDFSVRISYFVPEDNVQEAIRIFKTFFSKNRLAEIKEPENPKKTVVAKAYGEMLYYVNNTEELTPVIVNILINHGKDNILRQSFVKQVIDSWKRRLNAKKNTPIVQPSKALKIEEEPNQ